MTAIELPPKLCPLMTTVQIVPRGYEGAAVTERVGSGVPQIQQSIKGGGFRAPPQMPDVTSTKVQLGAMLKLAPGADPKAADPPLVADTLVVPCQRDACTFWCDKQRDCRLVASNSGAALAAARQLLNKAHENYDDNMEGLESPEESEKA